MISCNFYNASKSSTSSKQENYSIRPFTNHYMARHASHRYHIISECLFLIQKRHNTTFKDAKKQQVIKKILKLKKKI